MSNLSTKVPIICLESDTFKVLVKELALEIRDDELDPWLDEKEAMRMLRISSKTTFQKYRDGGKIDFRRLSKKHIVYRRQSLLNFIENSPKDEA
jgi:hypothetical protein